MLFDLRGRHRRRFVRVIYGGLAVLFGSGLVLFGVGGFGGTGILTSLTGNEGSNHASFSSQIEKYRKLTQREPNNAGAWETLAKNLLHEASGEAYVSPTTDIATAKGKEYYRQAAQAWTAYIALNPPKPNPELTQLMALVYGEAGLNEPAKAVEVLQIAVADRPTDAVLYQQLAEYAYKAHNTREGDLASEKAVELTPASDRTRMKEALAEVKANPSGEKTETVTTNGKTYVGKLNSKGELKGTEVKTAPTSSGSSSTTKTSTTKK
jgi:hypothetical protein